MGARVAAQLLTWWQIGAWRSDPRAVRQGRWIAIGGVTLLALILRTWNLGHPNVLVFDEIYYVRDAYSQLLHGAPTRWPEDLGKLFGPNEIGRSLNEASYVVHPPLGKWLISLGMLVFGADNGWGWRISTALAGTLAVFIVTLLGRRLFRSTAIGVLAGFFMAIDGLAIVLSRVSLLDNFLMLLGLIGAWFIAIDRDRMNAAWNAWLAEHPVPAFTQPPTADELVANPTLKDRYLAERARIASRGDWGPVFWRRPWLVSAGVVFGLAAGVKWSGLYFLAFFGIYVVVCDLVARRRAKLDAWFTAGIVKQGITSFALLVPVALVAYLATWTSWLLTPTAWNRGWASEPGHEATGVWSIVPNWARSLWHYHESMYGWHSTLQQEHPYQAHPLGWPLALRPTSMYFEYVEPGKSGCVGSPCSEAITSLPNPLIWWGGLIAIGYLIYRIIRFRDGAAFFITMGAASGYLPWVLTFSRSAVFQFYTISYAPFVYLALAYALARLWGIGDTQPSHAVSARRWWVALVLVLIVATSVFFYPLWTGTRTSFSFWQLHVWLPGWR
nr:phospholipid carrier-dependent glycosyltransferase [Lysinibacter cavernae]